MTGMKYDRSALKPIYDACKAVKLAEGCSAMKLQEEIGWRLQEEN